MVVTHVIHILVLNKDIVAFGKIGIDRVPLSQHGEPIDRDQ